MPSSKKILRNYMRKYFNEYISQFHKESKRSSFIINMSLNFCRPIFEIDFVEVGYKKEEFDSFFRNVFKDKIKLIKCD